jgi:hypothetical protein
MNNQRSHHATTRGFQQRGFRSVQRRPNPSVKPTVHAFGDALPSLRCAQLGAAYLSRWAGHNNASG